MLAERAEGGVQPMLVDWMKKPLDEGRFLHTLRSIIRQPGHARVLLVDDDAVSRKLSSKFLQVFGCTIDVAVDGVVAVNKMNLEKYDLVLMVCVFSFSFSFSFFSLSSLRFVSFVCR